MALKCLYFPTFRLNTEINGVTLQIQSKYGKIWTTENSVFGQFLRSVYFTYNGMKIFKATYQNPKDDMVYIH